MHDSSDRRFLGHPVGLAFLAFTEAFERFSYYGMQALLVLYLTKQLLLTGHVEKVAGFPEFRRLVENVYGHTLSVEALASAIFGLYTGLVYLTPLAGGFLADRLLGRTRTITLGALMMSAGHFLMAFDVSFLAALGCLVLGVGCFKGNIASQVGALYDTGDLRRADAFQIFYLAINGGVIAAPLIVGTLGEKVGWHYGFGAAGVGMLVALAGYLAGRRWLPSEAAIQAQKGTTTSAPLTQRDWQAIAVLIGLLPVLTLSVIGNQQIFNAYMLWAEKSANLVFFGKVMPTTWLVTLDSILSVSFLAGVAVFWRVWAKHHREPDEIMKMAIGSLLGITGFLALALGTRLAGPGGKVGIGWLIAFHTLNSISFANVFPVALALYARAAPAALSATIIGIFYLHLFAANNIVGWLGGLLERMSAENFWYLHAAFCGAAGVIFLVAGKLFGHLLAPTAADQVAP
ncbi:MAG TPA: peptide MFS transporter [Candidatus Didemnitutus sp.]|nr:peptide MFS transporter [Candidatus Didemnitutus sp.]